MEQFQVISEDIHEIFIDPRVTEPIPLTEEWLLKFGFDKKTPYEGKLFYEIGHNEMYFKVKEVGDIYNHWYFYKWEWILTTNIQYVHQIQNLYYSLTGEELTIK
jgi:hypothetical protein